MRIRSDPRRICDGMWIHSETGHEGHRAEQRRHRHGDDGSWILSNELLQGDQGELFHNRRLRTRHAGRNGPLESRRMARTMAYLYCSERDVQALQALPLMQKARAGKVLESPLL